MLGIVDFPQVVQEATHEFADVFACEPQRRHPVEAICGRVSHRLDDRRAAGWPGLDQREAPVVVSQVKFA